MTTIVPALNLQTFGKLNISFCESGTLSITRSVKELNLNNKTYNYTTFGKNNNIFYSSSSMDFEFVEYNEIIMSGLNKKNIDVEYYFNELEKVILMDEFDDEQIFSDKFLNDIFLRDYNIFNALIEKVLSTNDVKFYSIVLRSLTFTNANFDNDNIIRLIEKCIKSDNAPAISRAITTLEILNNEILNKKFVDVKINSKTLSRRLNKLL